MTRPIVVLRPEPGNAATVARIADRGRIAIALPLFEITPVDWVAPDPGGHDAMMFTSANAVRHGGDALMGLRALPVFAVGEATARAAREAGFDIRAIGDRDAAALIAIAMQAGFRRMLHLGGRESLVSAGGIIARSVCVYESIPRAIAPPLLAQLLGAIALLHSPRAGHRLSALVDAAGFPRDRIALAALSPAIGAAAGSGWAGIAIADAPDDARLIDLATTLAD